MKLAPDVEAVTHELFRNNQNLRVLRVLCALCDSGTLLYT